MVMPFFPNPQDSPIAGPVLQEFGHARDGGRARTRLHGDFPVTPTLNKFTCHFQALTPCLKLAQRPDVTKERRHVRLGLQGDQCPAE